MPFSNRIFCLDLESPNLSDVMVRLRQAGYPSKVARAWPSADLLSSFWTRAELESTDDGARYVDLECIRADVTGAHRLAEELDDFRADVSELSETGARARVLDHLAVTRSLVVVTFLFPEDDTDGRAQEIADVILTLFVERARGMAQRDGVGFLDEDDDVILALG